MLPIMAEGGDGESYGDKMKRIMREMVDERRAAVSAPSPTPGSFTSSTSSTSNPSAAESIRRSPSAAFGLLRTAGHGLLGTAGRGAVRRDLESSQSGVSFVTEIARKVG